jgi:hypothetical protein
VLYIYMPLAFHTPMINMYKKYNDHRSEDRGATRRKSMRVEHDVDQEPLAFCMWCCTCKKYKDRMGCRSRALFFLYAVLRV